MNCEIPWKSIESSACPPGVRPPFLPPASWLNPVRGGLFIAPARPPPSFFLFFSGAGLARLSNRPPPDKSGLKNKRRVAGRGAINRSPLAGFVALGAGWRCCQGTKARRCASISSSQPSSPNMWVITRASARCKERLGRCNKGLFWAAGKARARGMARIRRSHSYIYTFA